MSAFDRQHWPDGIARVSLVPCTLLPLGRNIAGITISRDLSSRSAKVVNVDVAVPSCRRDRVCDRGSGIVSVCLIQGTLVEKVQRTYSCRAIC